MTIQVVHAASADKKGEQSPDRNTSSKQGSPERKQQTAVETASAAQDVILTVKSSESTTAYFDADQAEQRTSPSPEAGDEGRNDTDGTPRHHNGSLTDYTSGNMGNFVADHGIALTRGQMYNYSGQSSSLLQPEEVDELRDLLPTIRSWQTAQTSSSTAVCGPPPSLRRTTSSAGISPRARTSTAGFSIAVLDDDIISNCSSEDVGEVDDYVRLSRDIYSILFVTDCRKHSFAFAFVVFVFQIFVLALVCVDVIDLNSHNPLNIPAGVSAAVRAAQFIAILVSVATQDDLITSISECTFCVYVLIARVI